MRELFNTDRTLYWIAIDIANQAGHDKKLFNERVDIVFDGLSELKAFNTASKNTDYLQVAFMQLAEFDNYSSLDSKYEFKNAVNALFQYLETGHTDHMVYLDASNQALQMYAVLTGDKKTASTCNLANGNTIADAYRLLANAMNRQMNVNCFTRSNCKKALMTTMYGKRGAEFNILEVMFPESDDILASFSALTGFELTWFEEEECWILPELTQAFKDALLDIAPRAMTAMDAIQELNNEEVGVYYWTMPDGFKVKYDVLSTMSVEIDATTKGGNPINFQYSIDLYAPSKKNAGMAPNVVHSVDGYVARQMVERMCGKYITTIHDAFGSHPADCDLMVQNYKDILIEILDTRLLADITGQIIGTEVHVSKDTSLTAEDIQNSVYLLS